MGRLHRAPPAGDLLVFPASIRDPADYEEVLAALARVARVDALTRARRDRDGWVVVVEASGRLQRAHHADAGVVALEVIAPMLDRALADAGYTRRVVGFLAPEWGDEAGAVVCEPEDLDGWRARGEVTTFAPSAGPAPGAGPSLDLATEVGGARLHLRDTVA